VGVKVVVLTVILVAMMTTPLAFSEDDEQYVDDDNNRYLSYEEKHQKELDRLLAKYKALEPNEGGPPEIEMVDFEKLAQNEIDMLYKEVDELQKIIDTKVLNIKNQNIKIEREKAKIVAAEEKIKKEWGAAPANDTQLRFEYTKLNKMTDELKVLLSQKDLILKKIDTKQLLLEIQQHDAKLIGVELSANCIAMAKLDRGSCPTYEDLLSLDNSIVEISGGFSMYDGYFHREKSNYQNSFRAYDNDDVIRILVDPPRNESARIKMITIEPNLGLYADAYSRVLIDGKRILSQDRIINNCYDARISADNWRLLLPDTIFTFRNGCESAEIDDLVTFDMPQTDISIWSSPHIQYQHWLEEMKTKCKELC